MDRGIERGNRARGIEDMDRERRTERLGREGEREWGERGRKSEHIKAMAQRDD